ncbi:transcription termination/antitermination protein NusG [Hydrogenophilus thiooxidans]|uniref:transcription termination/antitermination protein NusG n=1 Tax=Hydrogenophilus thiooxidans TaxID=2820326 RepID=UPI001C2464DF|nr:transcription termination/antitermination protein NusG [Hydrogenophilus thiooxidans]
MAKRWYVVQAHSGFEKQVQKALQERIKLAGMEDQFGQILVPVEKVIELRGGAKKETERKFFPGYLLVEMEMNDDTWHLVNSLPRVAGFVGGSPTKPAPLSEREVQALLAQIQEGGEKPKPRVVYEIGETVRVKEGPFADFMGTVEAVDYEKSRLSVAVSIFGRSTPVQLEFAQVEKV